MTELSQISEFHVSVSGGTASGLTGQDHFFKIVQTSSNPITVTQSQESEIHPDTSTPQSAPGRNCQDPMSPATASAPTTTSQLQHLLTSDQSYSLPSSPAATASPSSSSPGPRAWTHAHATYTPYTAR